MKWAISKTVNISEFGTDVMLAEMINRIGDYMHDPEPQHDSTLQSMTQEELNELLIALRKASPW